MIIGGGPAILTTRPRGDTDILPIELDISTSLLSAVPKIIFGSIVAVLALAVYGNLPPQSNFGPIVELLFQAAPIIMFLVGAYAFARGAIGLADKRTLRIADGQVVVAGKSLLKSENWSEPLSAYDGVRWRRIEVQRRTGSSGTRSGGPKVYQVFDLQHPDPGRCLPLHVTRLNEDIDNTRAKWEQFAKLLGLPAIDERDGVARVRAAEDVDKSIKELAEEGKIQVEVDASAPPAGLALRREGKADEPSAQVLAVTILAHRFPIWLYGALAAFSGFLLIVGAIDLAALPVIFGAALGGGVVWHWRYEEKYPRTVRITRSTVELDTPNPGNKPGHSIVQHDIIEGVHIGKQDQRGIMGGQIVIVTDQGEHSTGAGLSKEALAWLRDLILAAVTRA